MAVPQDFSAPGATFDAPVASSSRRQCLRTGLTGGFALLAGWPLLPAHADAIPHVNEAINRAGRQRMLSQRMTKAWLAMGQGIDGKRAERILQDSIALFERQLGELKAFAPTPQILATYAALEATWAQYKASLLAGMPDRERAEKVIALDAKVLKIAHQGTVQLEALSGKTLGKLVNVSGRQRMLSQRAAKFYLSQSWGTAGTEQLQELRVARKEFGDALTWLGEAKEATPAIREEIALAQQQWVFFDNALARAEQRDNAALHAKEVFASSENILQVMDHVTAMFSKLS
jgi:hypothetical protein